MGNDNTVRFQGLVLQIPPSPWRAHYEKATFRVHRYPDGHLAILHGPRRIADYTADGHPVTTPVSQAA